MINNIKIQNTDTIILTSPIGINSASVTMLFCNTSETTDEKITINIVKKNDAPSDINTVVYKHTIEKTDTFEFDVERFMLSEGDYISAKGEVGNLVSCTISYMNM